MLALLNTELPGSVDGHYDRDGSGVVLSLRKLNDIGALTNGSKVKFDDLELPVHIPVFPCDEEGDSYFGAIIFHHKNFRSVGFEQLWLSLRFSLILG